MIVLVVTPTKNIENYLTQTIYSVVSQAGDFELYYHIQDGQSSDKTVETIRKWEQTLNDSESLYTRCSKISFSWSSEKDGGMYDAINRGFKNLLIRWPEISNFNPEQVVMTWINGDDILAQGSIQTAVSIFRETTFQWLTGIPSQIREDGAIIDTRDSPCCYSRDLLAQGLNDGRNFHFVQQEGTYWRQSLWQLAGPLDSSFKLAGDWDLWKRFAVFSELVTVRGVLALFRRHSEQLSRQIESYYEEIDSVAETEGFTYYISREFNLEEKYFGTVIRLYGEASNWLLSENKVIRLNAESDIHRLESELSRVKAGLQTTQAELQTTQAELEAMRSSKFWKMRQLWINTKSYIGLDS